MEIYIKFAENKAIGKRQGQQEESTREMIQTQQLRGCEESLSAAAQPFSGFIACRLAPALQKAHASSKLSLPTPHRGHSKSSGTSLHGVPGAIPPSGYPALSSYSQPQTVQTYFIILLLSCSPVFYSSTSRPSTVTVTTCHGMNFPLCWSAFFAASSSPPQQGTSMRTTVTLLMLFSRMISVSFSE